MPPAAMIPRYDKPLRERIDRLLRLRASVGSGIFAALMVYGCRRDLHTAVMVSGICVCYAVFSTFLSKRVAGDTDRRPANVGFFVGNAAYVLALLGASHFSIHVYFIIPIVVLFYDGFGEGDTRPFVVVMLVIFAVVSLAAGARVTIVLASVATAGLLHWFSEGRALILRLALVELRAQAEDIRNARVRAESANEDLAQRNAQLAANYEALRTARARLAQSEKLAALGQLAAGIAHEVNNPLAVILGFAQGLERRLEPESTLRPPVTSIVRETVRCSAVVRELLTFSRNDRAEDLPVDLAALLTDTAHILEARARSQGTELIVEVEPDLPFFVGCKVQIQQVVVNLANNAFDALGRAGRVVIRCSRSDAAGISITVRDDGPGISEEALHRIFEPFFTTKEVGKGTGLGLSLVHEIVERHGGHIEVQTQLGAGTTMRVVLPLSPGSPAARDANAVKDGSEPRRRSLEPERISARHEGIDSHR